MSPLSLNPEDFSEGGEFPRGTMEITGARFGIHEFLDRDGNPVKSSYGEGNVAPSMAAILDLTNVDTGTVFPNRVYTIGQPGRYTASADGTTLEGESINRNSNFGKFMASLLELGFPKDRIVITNIHEMLVGTVAHWDQVQQSDGTQSRNVFPLEIYNLPGSSQAPSNGAVIPAPTPAPTPAPAPAPEPVPAGADVLQIGVQAVQKMIASSPSEATRQKLNANIFLMRGEEYSEDQLVSLMNVIYEEAFVKALADAGIHMDGEMFCLS